MGQFKFFLLTIPFILVMISIQLFIGFSPILILHYFSMQDYYSIGQLISICFSIPIVRYGLNSIDWYVEKLYKITSK